jgi:hypothetical protein
VEARAGEAGAEEEEEDTPVAEGWKADLERFHHDGITAARDERLAVRGLMASEARGGGRKRRRRRRPPRKKKKNQPFFLFDWRVVFLGGLPL